MLNAEIDVCQASFDAAKGMRKIFLDIGTNTYGSFNQSHLEGVPFNKILGDAAQMAGTCPRFD